MNILMIAPQPFFEPRGTPISVYQRLCMLSVLGHKVDLLTYHIGLDLDIPGVRIYRVPNIPLIREVKIGPSWPKLFLDMILFFQAVNMLIQSKYDVIHSHEEAAFFSAVLACVFRVRHLYDMHSSLPQQLVSYGFSRHGLIVRLFRLLERRTVRTCDALLTIGDDLERQVRRMSPKTPLIKIENLPIHIHSTMSTQNSVQELRDRLQLGATLPVVYTGTLERYQGLQLLLDSAVIVREHDPAVSFVIVGGTPKQITYWQEEARVRQLDDCVHFTGTVLPAEVLTYLEMAEILVSPRTNGTSTPLKIYSYLWSGKPTVATNVPAHTQVLNEENAHLVAPDKESFASGILRFARNPELRQRIGHQAQEYAHEMFDPSAYQSKMDQVYQMLAASAQVTDPPDILPAPSPKVGWK
jgi:glycosyltransferase involved in cell wall biosynthesis